jgi:parallel beta-helix repeat protein
MLNRNRLSLRISALSAVAAAALGLLLLIAVPAAQAALVSCPASITKCGCTITDAATHTLINNISAADGLTPKGDCIDIKHSDATLDGDFFDATGAGAAKTVGVRILSGAVRATVQNFDFIDDWDIGVEDDASSCNINNNDISSNLTTNILLKSVSKSVVNDNTDDDATGSCITVKNSNQNTFQDFSADSCGGDGITVTSSHDNSFSEFEADSNTGDGVDFQRSSTNSLSNFDADSNTGDGVAFTKNSNKNSASGYVADSNTLDGIFIDPSSNDKIDDGTADSNTLNGIEIAKGSKQDSVIFNTAITNGGTDLLDDNANCANGRNVWENNCFTTSSPSTCIVLGSGC